MLDNNRGTKPEGAANMETGKITDDQTPETLDERRRRWISLLRDYHYEPVIHDIIRGEIPKYTHSRIINPTDTASHMHECLLILASASSILLSAVEGTLAQRMTHDTALVAEYDSMYQRSYTQPCIYIHLLTDEDGNAPSSAQYLLIRDMVEDYISPSPSIHAHAIDNITAPPVTLSASSHGHRKHLRTPHSARSPARVQTLSRFTTGIANRCSPFSSHSQTTPLHFPPAEVGYTSHLPTRLAQHRTHRSSNAVMNLLSDVCAYLFRSKRLHARFEMRPYVVFLIWRREQVVWAEIVVSVLVQAWVECAGCNGVAAGRGRVARWVGRAEWEAWGREAVQERVLRDALLVVRERARGWSEVLESFSVVEAVEREEGDEGEEQGRVGDEVDHELVVGLESCEG